MELLIRLAKPEEQGQILQLQSLSIKTLLAKQMGDRELDLLVQHQRQIRETVNEIMIVAICNHELIGFAALILHKAQISALFVHPDFVRQGIGSNLLRFLEDILISRHCRSAVVLSSLFAQDFYQKNGYKKLYKERLLLGKRTFIDCIYLKKTLVPLTKDEKFRRLITFVILLIIGILSVLVAIF